VSADLVTVGETMVLLHAPEVGPLRHAHTLAVGVAGSESNVAIGVQRLGVAAAWIGRVGDDELVAGPGDIATVEPGTPHRFWNAGEGDARFLCEVRPALGFQSLIETMFTLAAASKTNRKGLPNPLRLAVIAKAHFDTVRLPAPPAFLQRAGLALAAPLGRLLGYRSTYRRAPAKPVAPSA